MAKASQRQAGGDAVVGETHDARLTPDGEARDRLYRLAYRFVWNQADAEDAVQSALAAAWRHAGQLRQSDKWWTWLCSIVVQRCRESRRKESVRRQHVPTYARFVPREEIPNVAEDLEFADRVRELLPRLAGRQYEVIVLRHLQGMSYDEIAAVLGISASTARVHAQAGREALRGMLFECEPRAADRR
jgi:RNA polymerase sigma-70 factor (ECF subfamily)